MKVLLHINNLDPFPAVNLKVKHTELFEIVNGHQGYIQSYNFNLETKESTPICKTR